MRRPRRRQRPPATMHHPLPDRPVPQAQPHAQQLYHRSHPHHVAHRLPPPAFHAPFRAAAPAPHPRLAPTSQWHPPPVQHLPPRPPQHPAYHNHHRNVHPVLLPSPPPSAGSRTPPLAPTFPPPITPICVVNNPNILCNRTRLAIPVVLVANGGIAVARDYGTLELKAGPGQPPMTCVTAFYARGATRDTLGGDIGFKVHSERFGSSPQVPLPLLDGWVWVAVPRGW